MAGGGPGVVMTVSSLVVFIFSLPLNILFCVVMALSSCRATSLKM